MSDCLFCRIAAGEIPAVVIHEDADLIAFLDVQPVRPGHTLIIPRQHHETFETLPEPLAAKAIALGQRLARRMKEVYPVERVAFLFTGVHIAHAHAHVVPMHDQMDITSQRYIVDGKGVRFSLAQLKVDAKALAAVKAELDFR